MLKNSLKIALFFSFLFAPNARSALNIGVIAPLAGEYQKVGEELVSGVRTAVDEINSQGGLKGEKINLIMVDDQCDDRIAVSTAQMMAVNVSERDKMSLVIGPYCSNALQKIAGIYAKAGILQIIPTSVSTSIQNGNYKGLVKMVGYKTRQAGDYFKFYQDHFPDRKVALIYDRNDKDVVEVAAAVQKLFADAGKTAAFQSYNFQNYDDDYDSIAEDVIRDGNKNCLYHGQVQTCGAYGQKPEIRAGRLYHLCQQISGAERFSRCPRQKGRRNLCPLAAHSERQSRLCRNAGKAAPARRGTGRAFGLRLFGGSALAGAGTQSRFVQI